AAARPRSRRPEELRRQHRQLRPALPAGGRRGGRVTRRPGLALALLLSLALTAPARADSAVADAAESKDAAAVRALLKRGGDVNASQGDGMTALHWAATNGDVELARMLLSAGANLRATTRLGGFTPLLLASRLAHVEVIEALLDAGASPNNATSNGTTPLMLAAASGNPQAVQLLLEKGADPAAKENAMGQTALLFAAAYGRADAIRVLVAKGADVKATSKVVDLVAFTREAEEAFTAQAAGGPTREASTAASPAPPASP